MVGLEDAWVAWNHARMLHVALLWATPFFGLSLHVDPAFADMTLPPLQVESVEPLDFLELSDDGTTPPPAAAIPAPTETASPAPAEPSYGELMSRRQSVASVHKIMGITTFAAMGATLALGAIQYRNLYGAWDNRGGNPCARGTATFGQGQCSGVPWLHLISGVTTFALYTTTFSLAVAMPDPGGLDEGNGVFARRLRLHKALRWVHLIGMVAQMALGVVIANGPRFGMDRANHYDALRALSTAHLAAGVVTFAALGWSGYLMAF